MRLIDWIADRLLPARRYGRRVLRHPDVQAAFADEETRRAFEAFERGGNSCGGDRG